MKPEKVLQIVLREMTAYGQGWRLDWSGFDGRTLRDQMNYLKAWADKALQNENEPEYVSGTNFLKDSKP